MNAEFAARDFANDWYERGNEDRDTYNFWFALLRDVLGVDKPDKIIDPQYSVQFEHSTGHIDIYIADTKVIIEQKSVVDDLTKTYKQSDGKFLTPYEQAKRYADALPKDKKPRWIITCNFGEFRIYNLTKNLFETSPTVIKLRDLRYQFERLKFLIDPTADDSPPKEKISAEAIEVIKKIYDAFAKNYKKNKVTDFEDDLNKLCTRLVFCLYAEDAQLFKRNQFFGYLNSFADRDRNAALQKLFEVLNTPEDKRAGLSDALKNFPYVNGELFAEKIALPVYNKDYGNASASIGTFNARKNFAWHEISPPIFGAMFESTFSRQNRQRKGGMYYTSEENIHKVIDPLFLDDLRDEFESAKRMQKKNRPQALRELQDKLAALNFLDPACGSGNFLTETFLSLRRLENEILEELRGLNVNLPDNPVKVSINQFFGIEIDSFAVAVAKVALWIAEIQMLQDTEGALGKNFKALPLTNYATIKHANANQIDWAELVAPKKLSYIIGNPPFVGRRYRSAEQQAEVAKFFNYKDVDYVACWYKKASEFIRGTNIRCAFVSTNSITQGEQVQPIWEKIFSDGIRIDFAHRTFKWLSDSENMAHVHCVVVGFSSIPNSKPKKIFDGEKVTIATNINAYLYDAPNIFIKSRTHPICDVTEMRNGNVPLDGDALKIEADDYEIFLRDEPDAKKYIKRLIGGRELIHNQKRYVLWLVDTPLDEIKKFPLIVERVELCKENRLNMKEPSTRELAETPTTFRDTFNPANYIALPLVSSENRNYIPMDYFDGDTIPTNQVQIIPDAQIYHFGVLTSSIHMAWMRTTCGRLKSDYRYSKDIVYNNFPWCEVSARQKRLIEESAQKILDVRKQFPDKTFAKLYNEDTMPPELRSAHKTNDFNVALAYGFEKFLDDEPRIVAELMKLYKRLTS